MAGLGTEVGDAYIEVHASTGPFRRELRREARASAQDFGKRFGDRLDKSVDSQLTPLGIRIREKLTEEGKLSGEGFSKAMEKSIIKSARDLDRALASAATSGDFSRLIGQFRSADEATAALNKRLGELRAAQEINLGQSNSIVASYNRYVKTVQEMTKAEAGATAGKKRVATQDRNNTVLAHGYSTAIEKLTASIDRLHAGIAKLDDRPSIDLRDDIKAFKEFAATAEDSTDKVDKAFRVSLLGRLKGSRNDFLNIIGSIGAFIEKQSSRIVSKGFDLIGTGLANLGTRLLQTGGPLSGFGQLLGMIGQRVQGLGAGGIDGLVVQIAAMSLAIQASAQVAGVFAAGLSLLTGAAVALATTLGGAVLGALTLIGPLLAGAAAGAGALAVAFSGLSDAQKATFGPLQELFEETRSAVQEALFSNIGSQVDALSSALAPLSGFLVSVAEATRQWFDQMLAAFSQDGPLGASLTILGQTLPSLFTGLLTLLTNLGAGLLGLFAAAAPAAQLFLDKLNGVVSQFAAWTNSAEGQESINTFLTRAVEIMGQLWGIATEVGRTLSIFWSEGNEAGGSFLQKIEDILARFNAWLGTEEGREALSQWFSDSVIAIERVGEVLGALIRLFDELDNPSTRLAFQFLLQALTLVTDAITWSQQKFQEFTFAVANGALKVGGAINGISTTLSNARAAFGRMGDAAEQVNGRITGFFSTLPRRIVLALGNLGGLLFGAGISVVNGLYNGIASAAAKVYAYVARIAANISATFRNALGIRSPSRVFAEYGRNLSEGLAIGITESTGLVDSALGNLIDSSRLSNINTPVSELAAQGGAAASSVAPAPSTTFEDGAITVVAPYADPMLVAVEVMDALAVRGK